ncbi:ABC-type transport system involved in cytochrome c biogenesis, permease component [Desulfitobacterium dichloroeliminans LMG P-21439]|uniref:Heme exporter protein C n=1 Tax=Desulfitobacterium dichloroeliminans (strain LMG P-21439 / DCA1) TaxID=871963 RepID=L0F633_DESDL|nr:cytochrome c biogenesis protein CcsA [Desulfitobacterium dichloroeliminans]AGA68637.1 ABC-type transport system involved in cytochrome c biogenesis, permease component [Desulfitobacterium dichloroeliminans LMG P-21439]
MVKRVLAWLTFITVLIATYLVFMWVPNERIMGPVQKIFYFHVSAAWIGFFAFFVVFVAGVLYLRTRNEKWDAVGAASAEIGIMFTAIVLITGPIWGRAAWNAWWTWDPRLTTTLVLFFIYIAYFMVRSSIIEPEKKARIAAIFGMVGFIDVPIVWFSIRWWRTIHPVVVSSSGFAMSSKMVVTLLVSVVAFTFLYFFLLANTMFVVKMQSELAMLKEKIREGR